MVKFKVTFVGTGVSTAMPQLSCILRGEDCAPCQRGYEDPTCKSVRGNVSLALTFADSEGQGDRCILVDVGKTFRVNAIKYLKPLGVTSADAIFLTHDHFDAIGGLDDVRDLQESVRVYNPENNEFLGYRVKRLMRILGTELTISKTQAMFPYLFPPPGAVVDVEEVAMRRVAKIHWETIPARSTMVVHGLNIETFPVYHGGTYVSLGFSFGSPDQRFVYISDVNGFPEETEALLASWGSSIHTLVLDALSPKPHTTHFSIPEAIDVARKYRAPLTLLVGFGCDAGVHEDLEASLAKLQDEEGLVVRPAYDGLSLMFAGEAV